MKIVQDILASLLLLSSCVSGSMDGMGSHVGTKQERKTWWMSLSSAEQEKLSGLFYEEWFDNKIDEDTRIAYAYMAQGIYDFLTSGADSRPDDHYIGFAPLMLRASFHGAGTFHSPTGTGGSNGGTIYHHAELADDQNSCIGPAPMELFDLFHGHDLVPLSDALVIAGVISLDVMDYPRMDLLKITGGRDMIEGVAYRDRLPNPDFDPMQSFQEMYDFTLPELIALIGGGHQIGSAHGTCTGYVGQWSPTPLSWFGPGGSAPTFFPDLLRTDWRWYEVCTYSNNTSVYTSVPDPFATGAIFADEEEEEGGEEDVCGIAQGDVPQVCEEQAMRGCDFADGAYGAGVSPCDINKLQFRLKSDFFLKANPKMMPIAQAFADDADYMTEQFGIAYHKLTHFGLDRCGLSGHGCSEGTVCKQMGDNPFSKTCAAVDDSDNMNMDAMNKINSNNLVKQDDFEDFEDTTTTLLYVVMSLCIVILILGAVTMMKFVSFASSQKQSTTTAQSSSSGGKSLTSDSDNLDGTTKDLGMEDATQNFAVEHA